MENIQSIINRLENEIKETQKGLIQTQSLIRLKEVAKIYSGTDKVISFSEIEEIMKNRPPEEQINTGWSELDKILKGFRLKQLITISAPMKHGKTSFCVDLTMRLKDQNPLWFPFEEGAEELIQKFIDRNEHAPLSYTPQHIKGNTTTWIEERIIESIAKYGTRVVFIDQLDFIVPFSADRHDLRVGQVMRELKSIAKKWNIIIFIICHLVKTKMDMQPTLEDLRGSASIGQESDTVILLWRETKRENGQIVITNNINVSIQANRRTGKTGNIKMIYTDNGRFLEEDWKIEDQERSSQKEIEDTIEF